MGITMAVALVGVAGILARRGGLVGGGGQLKKKKKAALTPSAATPVENDDACASGCKFQASGAAKSTNPDATKQVGRYNHLFFSYWSLRLHRFEWARMLARLYLSLSLYHLTLGAVSSSWASSTSLAWHESAIKRPRRKPLRKGVQQYRRGRVPPNRSETTPSE